MSEIIIDDTDSARSRRPAHSGPGCLPGAGPIPAGGEVAYLEVLEDDVRRLVGDEPKNFARAAVAIHEILRLRGHRDEASRVADLFDVTAMVLYQVGSLVTAVHRMGRSPDPTFRSPTLEQIDDLVRLIVMTLDGDTNADIVHRLVEFRDAVAAPREDPTRPACLAASGRRLDHLVNAFFFDRLTAIPAVRDYVVGLELGI